MSWLLFLEPALKKLRDNMEYSDLEKVYSHEKNQTLLKYPQLTKKIENAISSSFSLYYSIRNLILTQKTKDKTILAYFYRNSIYLSSSYSLILKGMIDPAANNFRTVFETICWSYAFDNEETFIAFEEISNLENEKITKNWSTTKERKLQNLRRKNNFQKMLKTIYTDFDKFFSTPYWILSQKSHPSLFGANFNTPSMEGFATIDKNPSEVFGYLRNCLFLLAENLLCFVNKFFALIDKKELTLLLSLISDLHNETNQNFSLVPDKLKTEYKLVIK